MRVKPTDFLAPRYWPTWLGLGLLRMLVLLPYPWQMALGRGVGRLLHRLLPSRRHVAEVNVGLCLPELDQKARDALVRRNFEATACSVFEAGMSWWAGDGLLEKLHHLEGKENLERALAQGKGVILLGGHYATLEVSGRLLCFHYDCIYPIYKPARNRLFEAVMASSRRRIYAGLLVNSDMRGILQALKKGNVIWYAPDQDFGRERSVFAPFMGFPTATLTTTSRLAKLSGAPVLPFYSQRLPGSKGFLIKVGPPLEGFPSGDEVADATRVNRTIEQQVRAAPEQYLWVHRRFKTRPLGEPSLYRR